MSDSMKVVTLDTTKKQKQNQEEMLKILEAFRERVLNNEIDEFVMSSIDTDGNVQVSVFVKDSLGGIGLFELGKQTFMLE